MPSEGLPNRRRARRYHDTSCHKDELSLDSENDKSRRLKDEWIFSSLPNLGMSFLHQTFPSQGSCHREGIYFWFLNLWQSVPSQRVGVATLVALFIFGAFKEYNTFRIHPLRPRSDREVNRLSLQVLYFDFSMVDDLGGWTYPRRDQMFPSYARLKVRLKEEIADHGGLHFHAIRDPSQFERKVNPNDHSHYEKERNQFLNEMDTPDLGQLYWHDDELDKVACHRPNWRSLYFPNCNDFHEIDLSRDHEMDVESEVDQNYDSYRFNHGYYREAWLVNDVIRSEGRVLKTLRGKHEFTERTMLMVQRDAIVMERLTSSPRIINMFGHCGTSITVEPISYELEQYAVPSGYMKKEALSDKFDVKPQNDFDPIEKLSLALEMAETLAILHGYEGGVIVHDDVQLCQWLRTKKGTLVLGDFNRAEIMNWDNEKETYCTYNNGYAYGNVSTHSFPFRFESLAFFQLTDHLITYTLKKFSGAHPRSLVAKNLTKKLIFLVWETTCTAS